MQRHAAPRARRLAEDCAARARAVAPGFLRAFVRSAWAHHADNYCAACRVGALVEDFSFVTQGSSAITDATLQRSAPLLTAPTPHPPFTYRQGP